VGLGSASPVKYTFSPGRIPSIADGSRVSHGAHPAHLADQATCAEHGHPGQAPPTARPKPGTSVAERSRAPRERLLRDRSSSDKCPARRSPFTYLPIAARNSLPLGSCVHRNRPCGAAGARAAVPELRPLWGDGDAEFSQRWTTEPQYVLPPLPQSGEETGRAGLRGGVTTIGIRWMRLVGDCRP
jgi:hypothetical protein